MTTKEDPAPSGDGEADTIIQYIIMRTDLKWGQGALIAQACHASVASIGASLESPATKAYLADMENMHKIVLKAEDASELERVRDKLAEARVAHHLWIEKPENVATCLAVAPQPRSLVAGLVKHLKLLR